MGAIRMALSDKILTCVECGSSPLTVGEQEFFASRGYTNEPRRCPDSRGPVGASSEVSADRHEKCIRQFAPSAVLRLRTFRPRGDRPVYSNDCFSMMRR